MRYILFRGKRVDNGEWSYGDLITCVDKFYIHPKSNSFHVRESGLSSLLVLHEVIPEIVGQFTGLTDKNGKQIFEGDIMQLCSATYPCLVYWDGRGWAWLTNGKRRDIDLTREKMSIIGNIHDNPELLEDKQ